MTEIDLKNIEPGDTVTIRCGGELVIRNISTENHEFIKIWFVDMETNYLNFYYDGRHCYIANGKHPLDIIGITKKPCPPVEIDAETVAAIRRQLNDLLHTMENHPGFLVSDLRSKSCPQDLEDDRLIKAFLDGGE